MMKFFFCFAILCSCVIGSCDNNNHNNKTDAGTLDTISVKYLKLGLAIGQYDPDFVDAYYGPENLKPAPLQDSIIPKEKFFSQIDSLLREVRAYQASITEDDSFFARSNYLEKQLMAFSRRIKIFTGMRESFEKESAELFNVNVPVYDENHFQRILNQLDSLVPGAGSLQDRLNSLNAKFVIPQDKVDTVFRLSIAEARRRTGLHFDMPKDENFTLEYVTNKPWSGYNWYKGNYTSVIQINTDLPIMIDRAIDLACHEGYPGHHVYNMMLEKKLYREKGWKEISLYPLFSPQSLIAEGSANYGIEMAFPGEEKINFTKNVLLPAAGLDTTGISAYYLMLGYKLQLNYVRNEVARGILNKTMLEQQATDWLVKYGLYSKASAEKALRFTGKYGAYVICYNYGQDLVKHYVEATGSDLEKRWSMFGKLLSNPVIPGDLEDFWNAPAKK